MRTLKYMKPEKQKEKARETMEIYAPIAHRLGTFQKSKVELDDLSLKYLEPRFITTSWKKDRPPEKRAREIWLEHCKASASRWTRPGSKPK